MSFTRNCPTCGKELSYTSEYYLQKSIKKNKSCRSCSHKGNTNAKGKRSEETRRNISKACGGNGNLEKFCKARLISWSNAVRKRDEYVCQHCNHDFYPHECHAHHIMPKSKFPQYAYDLDNGITLCIECHRYEHKHYGRYR